MSCNIQIHVYVFLWFQTSVLLIEVYTSFVFPVNKLIHLLNNASDDLFAVKSQISKWQKTSTLYSLKKYKYMYIISNLSISELRIPSFWWVAVIWRFWSTVNFLLLSIFHCCISCSCEQKITKSATQVRRIQYTLYFECVISNSNWQLCTDFIKIPTCLSILKVLGILHLLSLVEQL